MTTPTTPTPLASDDLASIERGLEADRREATTATKRKTAKKAAQPTKKTAVKKATKTATPDAEAIGSALGDELTALAKRAGKADGAAAVAKLASTLAKNARKQSALVALRDAVNALAATLREANQKALAKQVAAANRGVRRLERAAR